METKFIFNQKVKIFLVLAFLVLSGFCLRVYHLDHDSLWIDEGFSLMSADAIREHGYPLLKSGDVEKKDLLLPYVYATFGRVSAEKTWQYRLVSVLAGTGSIILAYFLGKPFLGEGYGLIFSGLICFSYWQIAWSRQARSYSAVVLVLLLALLLFWKYLKNKEKRWLYGLASVSALMLLAKTGIGVLLISSFAVFFFIQKEKKWALVFVIVAGAAAIIFRHKIFDPDLILVNNLLFYLMGYFWNYYSLIFILAITGFWVAYKKDLPNRDFHRFSLILFLVALVYFSFFYYITQRRFMFFLSPLLFFYASYFFLEVFGEKSKKAALGATVVILLACNFIFSKAFVFWPQSSYALEEYTPQPNFKIAYGYVKQNLGDCRLISAYPYMDYLYLGRFDYSMAVSYSGKQNDPSLNFRTEYYTDSVRVFGSDDVEEIKKKGDVCAILDTMSLSRGNREVVKFFSTKGKKISSWDEETTSAIYLYQY